MYVWEAQQYKIDKLKLQKKCHSK